MPSPFILTGPTGSGKTELALALAEEIGAEIVSADSMSLYRGMDILTAKPTAEQRQRVPHHLIDVLEPWQPASVAWWREQALACCDAIWQRGKTPLFVGGTPLYLKALLHGLFEGPPANAALRQRLGDEAAAVGNAALHARLATIDPPAAERIHPNDLRRVIRALEVFELTGQPISSWQVQWERTAPPTFRAVWLDVPRPQLHDRINRRVEAMFAQGIVEEVRRLRQLSPAPGREASQALGHAEIGAYLDGAVALAETIARVKTHSRQFAKRQVTWFRSMPEIRPVTNELTSVLNAFRM